MGIRRLNHAVLYVRETARTVAFYRDVLGFRVTVEIPGGGGAFLVAPGSDNDHDLGVFALGPAAGDSPAGVSTVGLYHLAWEVPTLADLEDYAQRLTAAGALVGASDHGTTKSLYAADPDGLEFEVVWLVPTGLLVDSDRPADPRPRPLDIRREIDRFGAHTPGLGSPVATPYETH